VPRLRIPEPVRRSSLPPPPPVLAGPATQDVDVALAVREVLGFPIRWLRALPLPSALGCSFVAHEGGRVWLCTAPIPVPGADPPAPVFVGPEVDALATAAEYGRATAATLRGWCARKAGGAAWRLTPTEALGALAHPAPPLGWTVGQVLWALGLRLECVEVGA